MTWSHVTACVPIIFMGTQGFQFTFQRGGDSVRWGGMARDSITTVGLDSIVYFTLI